MEEFFYISHDLTEEDSDGHIVLAYELMIEAEHQYRIKRGGGAGCCHSPSHASSAPPYSAEMLECIAWAKPESKTLERLVWSVYDGLISPGPTPKVVGPKSTIRWLGTSPQSIQGLQVRCPARTSAQFNKPPTPKLWSVILTASKQDSKKNWGHGHCFPKNWRCLGWSGRRWPMCRPIQISNGLDVRLSALVWWWNDWILAPALPTDR